MPKILRFRPTTKATRPRIPAKRAAQKVAREELGEALAVDYADVISRWRSQLAIGNVESAVASGGRVAILEESLELGRLQAAIGVALEGALGQAVMTGAALGLRFGPAIVAGVPVSLVGEIAASYVDLHGADLVVGIGARTRQAVQRAIIDGFADRLSPTELAEQVGNAVGLTDRGAASLSRYRRELVAQLIPNDDADTPAIRSAIAEQLDDYRAKLLMARGRVIGQTETQNALAEGERGFWEVAVSEQKVERRAIRRVWNTVRVGVCPVCESLEGQLAGMDESFQSSIGEGFFGTEPPAHVNCHCYLDWSVE